MSFTLCLRVKRFWVSQCAAAKGAKDLSLPPAGRTECLISYFSCGVGSILVHHAFLDKGERKPVQLTRILLKMDANTTSHNVRYSTLLSIFYDSDSHLKGFKYRWNEITHIFLFLSKIVKSCWDSCGLFVAAHHEAHPRFSNLPTSWSRNPAQCWN